MPARTKWNPNLVCLIAPALALGATSCGSSSPNSNGDDELGGGNSPSTYPTGAGAYAGNPAAGGSAGAAGSFGVGGSLGGQGAVAGAGAIGGGGIGGGAGAGGTPSLGGAVGAGGTAPIGGAAGSGAAPASGGMAGSGAAPGSGGAAAGGSTGYEGENRGCGQGTSCTPGNDLPVPSADQGFQVALPPNAVTMMPGQEQFLCYYKNLPSTSQINVGAFQSWMSPDSSHHFIAFESGQGVLGSASNQPDGTLQTCAFGTGTWLFATSLPGQIIELDMPPNVGLPLTIGSQIILNMHFINTGTTNLFPVLKLNLLYAQNIQYKAGAMVSFNVGIDVPPYSTQTVTGTCSAPVGANFFALTTHTHKHATAADVNIITGGQTINIVHTTDWEHPDVGLWNSPNFLTVQQGDSFSYSCAYANMTGSPVTVGETAATNEMCMAIGYYFPAGTATCR